MATLQIIVGSTRPERAADLVVPWVDAAARRHGAFDVELLDLRQWPLPMFAEGIGTIGDFDDPSYSEPVVRAWNDKIRKGDAYLVVTPEYNHSIPGVLKNAFDSVFLSFAFRNKPIGAVGYSGGVGGAIRAIEHLAHIAVEADAVPLRNTVILPYVIGAFDEHGEPVDPRAQISLTIALDDLAWWAKALGRARSAGELAPGTVRMRKGLDELRTAPA